MSSRCQSSIALARPSTAPTGGEEARSFLQERLAFFALLYVVIDGAFFVASQLVGGPLSGWGTLFSDLNSRLVVGVIAIYLVQWAVCRRSALADSTLRLVDGASTLLAAGLNAAMVFAIYPGELSALSYSRALLIFTLSLVMRAVIVPSSARRTLVLGLVAGGFPLATTSLWYAGNAAPAVPPIYQAFWTANWCLGAVVVSAVASHVIFGLRRQVREACQFGQYTLLEKIGSGGMGEVYRASHAMLRRPTAVKLLLPDRASPQHLERFEREVQLTASLTHPNTVAVFDYGRTRDGVFYYAMEYLDGVNLEDLVRRTGPQPPARVRHILRQVAGSLAEAHRVGLIHRDVKPANVILVPERGGTWDVAKVVDFGLVRDLERDPEITDGEGISGTPLYLSPEAIAEPERVDSRSDLYSLGCVGWFLLTGRPLFEGGGLLDIIGRHLHARPGSPAAVVGHPLPPSLTALVLACLEKEPDRRPASARAVIAALDAADDLPSWTDEEARIWWELEGPRATKRDAARAPSTGETTVISRALPIPPEAALSG